MYIEKLWFVNLYERIVFNIGIKMLTIMTISKEINRKYINIMQIYFICLQLISNYYMPYYRDLGQDDRCPSDLKEEENKCNCLPYGIYTSDVADVVFSHPRMRISCSCGCLI